MYTTLSLLMAFCLCQALRPVPTMPLPSAGTLLCGPLGSAILPCSLGRMNRVWGRLAFSLFSVTLCPLGSEPAVFRHSISESLISTVPSPCRGPVPATGGQKQQPLPPFFLPTQKLLREKQQQQNPFTLFPQPRINHCTSARASKPWCAGTYPNPPFTGCISAPAPLSQLLPPSVCHLVN